MIAFWKNKKITTFLFWTFLGIFGGIGYYGIEILYRGHSHPTMIACGGLCLIAVVATDRKLTSHPLLIRAAIGAGIITSIEFVFGIIFNICLGWDIWDYSVLHFHILGQIAPLFSFFWFLFSIPICFFSTHLRKNCHKLFHLRHHL